MRTRAILFVVAILLVAAFAALNWGEIVRSTPLSFGLFVADAPLGLLLLTLLAAVCVAFILASAAMRTQALVDSRTHHKTLEQQRTLADKAEVSRFTDLRQHLDAQLRELRERDAIAATEFQKAMVTSQRELRTQLEQINRTLAARLNELEHRIDGRLGHALPATPAARPELVRTEHGQSQPVRDEDKAVAAGRPAESGWRKWF
jgi:TolA-binding protein